RLEAPLRQAPLIAVRRRSAPTLAGVSLAEARGKMRLSRRHCIRYQAMPSNAAEVDALRWKKFPVLDDGFVCLVDVMGDDQAVVQAARVSYGEGTRKVSDDRGLIRYLLRNRTTTPFEMVEIKFLVRVPMDCWRQWIRHRTANVNEYSTRYSLA